MINLVHQCQQPWPHCCPPPSIVCTGFRAGSLSIEQQFNPGAINRQPPDLEKRALPPPPPDTHKHSLPRTSIAPPHRHPPHICKKRFTLKSSTASPHLQAAAAPCTAQVSQAKGDLHPSLHQWGTPLSPAIPSLLALPTQFIHKTPLLAATAPCPPPPAPPRPLNLKVARRSHLQAAAAPYTARV
jgi:hypothetical protein